MKIDFSSPRKITFGMIKYVKEMLQEYPLDILKVHVQTPAANHLFEVGETAVKLGAEQSVLFHHLMAKLLYLCQRTRPDLQLAVAFLTTRVKSPRRGQL